MKVTRTTSSSSVDSANSAEKAEKPGRFSEVLEQKRKESAPQFSNPAAPPEQNGQFVSGKAEPVASSPTSVHELAQEIVSHISTHEINGVRSLEVQFTSQTLAGLKVDIRSQQGQLSINFLTAAPAVNDLLTRNLSTLRSALESKGLALAQLRVIRRSL